MKSIQNNFNILFSLNSAFSPMPMEYRINTGTRKAIGMTGSIFIGLLIVGGVIVKMHLLGIIFFSGIFLLCVWEVLSSGVIVLSNKNITFITPFATYEMPWEEVKTIKVDSYATSIVFQGAKKRLAIPCPFNWSGIHKDAIDYLDQQAQLLNIHLDHNSSAIFNFS